jgi:putative ABC transport system substrate-binding protein
VRRRQFITLLGGAAATRPLTAGAQQRERMRRIGVLMSASPDDPYQTTYLSAFMQGLQERGWTIGRNVRVDYRWGAGEADLRPKYAAELIALAPDVILATAGSIVGGCRRRAAQYRSCS